jgi:hypothetical protein
MLFDTVAVVRGRHLPAAGCGRRRRAGLIEESAADSDSSGEM